jgi:ATP-dependent exoDNAse (exonuclease V) alpha subunit
MAIYRLEAQIIGRKAKDLAGRAIAGRSVSMLAKAAYRSGQRLRDEQLGRSFDYGSRTQEVVQRRILAPEESPAWLSRRDGRTVRERLWNEVELAEKRKDSQLAREFVIALPVELNGRQRLELLVDWCNKELVSRGYVVDVSIHRSKDGKNPHAHVLSTLRPIGPEGFGLKPSTAGLWSKKGAPGFGAKGELVAWRESWEVYCNAALEEAGLDVRVDSRSLAEQGIDRIPEPKIGVSATAMKRAGKNNDPNRVRDARRVRVTNEVLGDIRAVERGGDVHLNEGDVSIWERAQLAAGWLYGQTVELLKDESSGSSWRARIERERNERGPILE